MSSSSNVQKNGDVETSDAAGASQSVLPAAGKNSPALPTVGAVPAQIYGVSLLPKRDGPLRG